MVTINIAGKEYELFYNTKALIEIEKLCGSVSKLGEWLYREEENKDDNGNLIITSSLVERIAEVLAILVNGGIFKTNCEISMGLQDGTKQNFINSDVLMAVMSPNEIIANQTLIITVISGGQKFELPEGVPEPDPDLLDVESEKKE